MNEAGDLHTEIKFAGVASPISLAIEFAILLQFLDEKPTLNYLHNLTDTFCTPDNPGVCLHVLWLPSFLYSSGTHR